MDDHLFDPCGYSANGLLGPYYYTIHVTPEPHCSYASYETTVPVKQFLPNLKRQGIQTEYNSFLDVVTRVIQRFQPNKFSIALIVRRAALSKLSDRLNLLQGNLKGFKQKDCITHDLGRWVLVFGHYQRGV